MPDITVDALQLLWVVKWLISSSLDPRTSLKTASTVGLVLRMGLERRLARRMRAESHRDVCMHASLIARSLFECRNERGTLHDLVEAAHTAMGW